MFWCFKNNDYLCTRILTSTDLNNEKKRQNRELFVLLDANALYWRMCLIGKEPLFQSE